jgi:broad specificity phosphatase PhoE
MTLRLRRWQGKWIAEDKEAGYYSEMPDCDAYTLMADWHQAESIRLRIQAAKDPADLARPQSPPQVSPLPRSRSWMRLLLEALAIALRTFPAFIFAERSLPSDLALAAADDTFLFLRGPTEVSPCVGFQSIANRVTRV